MNPLRLQILLGAVDKITAPLKAVSGQSRITAKDLVDTKKKIRDLETQAGQIEGYKTLGAQIGATKAQLKQAEGSFSELQRKIAETPKPTRVMINEFNKAEKALSQLKTKQGEMITRHAQMGEAMRKTGINTGNLSETQRRLKTDLAAANTVLDSQRTKLGQLADQQKRLNQVKANYRQTQELRGQIAGHGATALATGTAVGMTTLKPVIEFARAETSVVDLKVSMMGKGGQVRQEFQAISDLATKLGNKLPGTTADFQNMMSTLIQQGMSAKSILGGLGEATAYLGVQLKMPFDQAALFAAKLQDATGTAENDMMGLMDTIQRSFYLGVDSGNMLGAFTKLTPAMGILRKSGLEAAKVLAPLVIMADQAGMAGESSGNAYRKVFQMSMNTGKIAKATKGTGLKLNFTDGKGEFAGMENMFAQLAKLKGLNTERRLQVLKGIYGDDAETLQVLELIISKGMDGYRATQKKMADQAALQERVNAQLGTLGSLWDAATGTFTNAMVNFGEAIAPEIKAITEWIADLSESLGNWAKKNPELSNTLMKVGGILSAVTIAFGGLSLAVAALLGPMAIMKLTFGVLGIHGSLFGNMLKLLLAPFKMVLGVVQLLTGAFIRMGIAMLTNPLAWIIGLVAALAYGAYLLYENWDGVSRWFNDLWEKCKAPLTAYWDLLKELFSWTPLGMLTMHWGEIWAFFDTLPAGAANKGQAIIDGLIGGITAKWESLKAKIKALTDLLPDWMKGDGSVTANVNPSGYLTGNYDQPALAAGYDYGTTRRIREQVMPAALRQPADTARTIREQVLPAALRQPAEVLNRSDPRIVTPPRPVARGSTTTEINAPIHIVQQPGQSGADVAQEVSRELDKRERQAAARGRATLGDRN
ncbi:phage tail tape measure protein [Aeromonas media]|uniref:phage tail tape measure protein n=1 Tax=Aeromonas media TaxID=651 RepID=UPI00148B1E91|nr:phage tail tape measure protein [Aeromonas media]QJT25424.1 phage tail tape measure protein [Aeromonas media]